MKTLRVVLLLTIVLFGVKTSNGQNKKIAIDKFQDETFSSFNDGSEICNSEVKKGFFIQVKKDLKIETVSLFNGDAFSPISKKESNTLGDIYEISDESSNNLKLRISRKEGGQVVSKEIVIKVKVCSSGNPSDNQPLISLKDCKDLSTFGLKKGGDCQPMTYDNNFGEDVNYYSTNTVVYIYDFNKDPAKRIVWKLYKDKAGALQREVADMSSQVLKPRQQVYFKVVNINLFLYDITIADSTISFDSEPSALFNRIFLGDSTLMGGLISNFSSNKNVAQSSDIQKASLDNLAANIRCFFQRYYKLQEQMLKAYDPCENFSCCLSNSGEYFTLLTDLLDIKIGMAVVFQDLVKKQQDKLTAFKADVKKCEDLKAKLEANAKERKPIEDKPETNRTKEEKDKLTDLLKQKEDLEKQNKACAESELASKKEQIAALEQSISYYSAINDLQNKMLPAESDIRKLIVFLQNMVRQNNSFAIGPLQLNGNRLDIDIKIQSKDSITKYFSLNQYRNQWNYKLAVKSRAFVSFSTGSFIGIGDRLKNITYDWQQVPNSSGNVLDTSKYMLVQSGYTPPPMGFAALANVEWKLSRDYGLGVSFGAGITIERKPRAAYFGGGSFFIGNLRQFVITAGLTAMQVEKLNNNFQAVADQRILYATKADLKYYDEFKLGAFISLTYTPFKAVKSK